VRSQILSLLFVLSCELRPAPDSESGAQDPAHLPQDVASEIEVPEREDPLALLMQQVLGEAGLPGAPDLERNRATVLVRSKGEPVIFERPPVHEPGDGAAKHYSYQLLSTSYPWDVIERLLPTLARNPDVGRALLLREGYFYAETPDLAFSLVSQVGIQHLFREDRVWIHRGESILHARRKSGRYYYEDGPFPGEPARLLLFDRVGTGDVPEPLHMDVRALRYRTFFDEVKVRHMTKHHVVANLRYGDIWVPSLLKRDGARLELIYQEIAEDSRLLLQELTAEASRRLGAIS